MRLLAKTASLGLLGLLLCACSRSGSEPEATSFPVRLLPLAESAPAETLFTWTGDGSRALDGWHWLRPGDATPTLDPAAATMARIDSGAVVCDESVGALIRFFVLPAEHKLDLTVHVDPGPDDLDGDCTRIPFVRLQALEGGETLESRLTTGTIVTDEGRTVPLTQALGQLLAAPPKRDARWTRGPDETGLATARVRIYTGDRNELWALGIPTASGARIGSLSLDRLPELKVGTRTPGPHALEEGAEPVAVDGLSIPCILIEPGHTVEFGFAPPVGTRLLSYHVATDPTAPAGAIGGWSAELLSEDGTFSDQAKGPLGGTGHLKFRPQSLGIPARLLEKPLRIRFSVSGQVGLLLGQPMLRGTRSGDRPNLLIVSLDTLRADHLGCYGHERKTSPVLDQLAADGTLFETFQAVAPYTLPTHATLFTGLMPARHGAVATRDRLDASRVSYLPRILADQGFVSAAFTGGGFLSDEFGFAHGFDRYGMVDPILPQDDGPLDGEPTAGGRRDHDLRAALRWIDAHQDERWFLFLHSFVVHEYEAPLADRQQFERDPTAWPGLGAYVKEEQWRDAPPDAEQVRQIRDRYDATLHYADRMLGRLFRALEQRGLMDRTLLVVTSDHGEEFWEHGALKHSATLYDEMLRVPLIIRAPGQPRGVRVTEPISQADLTPTLLDLLGLPPIDGADGRTRAGWIRGRADPGQPSPLYAQIDTSMSRRTALRVGRFKLIQGDTTDDVERPARADWELFDLDADPAERNNLADELSGDAERLRRRLLDYEQILRNSALRGPAAPLSDELQKRLEELGY